MSKATIKIGVIGCANIAERFVIPAINNTNAFNLVAIASRTSAKAEEFANKFNIKPVASYEALLDIEDLQAVYIPLPNSLHYEWIKKSLAKGKHVLVEKSMACSVAEVEELNKEAQELGLVLLENFQFRKHAQLAKMKAIVAEGKIGELRAIRSSFGFPAFSDKNNIRYKKELGGGALLDAGAYPLKIAQEFVSDILYVDSASLHVDPEYDVDTWGAVQLKGQGTYLTVQAAFGFDHAYQCSVELWGSEGVLKSNRIFTSPPGAEAELVLTNKEGTELIKIVADNHFENMLAHFADLIYFPEKAASEYIANVQQARLIEQLRSKACE